MGGWNREGTKAGIPRAQARTTRAARRGRRPPLPLPRLRAFSQDFVNCGTVSVAGQPPGVYLALTHSGVTLGPAIGDLIAEAIETSHTPEALRAFSFERFQSV